MNRTDRIARRRRQVAAAILTGAPHREVAERLGVSKATITADVAAVRRIWAEESRRDYGSRVAEELAKLQSVEDRLMRTILAPDASETARNRSVDRLLGIMNHRARLLGLYAPERHEVIHEDHLDAEIARLEAELAAGEE